MPLISRAVLASACSALMLAACAGKPSAPGGRAGPGTPPQGGLSAINALDGAFVAMPIALVLTGYDFDHDGVISREELDRGADMEWGRMNPDGMAAISLIELARWSETSLGSAMARPGHLAFDQNGSGTIDKSELRQLLLREYANADRDGDGQLTRAELVRQLNLPRSGQKGQGGGRPPGGGAPPGGGRPR